MSQSKLFGVAAILIMLAAGCSTKSSDPPDPSLTLEVVTQNVAKYEGKRVRWFGKATKVESKDKTIGKGVTVNAIFVDTSTDFSVVMRAFAFEAESDKDMVSFMMEIQSKPCWVTGTVAGTHKMKATVSGGAGPSSGEKELEIPFLTDVQLEQAQESMVKP